MTDQTGQVVWSASYDPFGLATVNEDPDGDGNSITFDARFPGQYYDQETGLHYNYFRYYDPSTGRYITSDPLGIIGGEDLNPYRYVESNPVNWIDPLGLVKWKGKSSSIAAVVGGGAVRYKYDLESDCVDGRKTTVSIVAGGFALGAGAEFAGTVSRSEFVDNNATPDASVFEGTSYYASIGHAFIGIGYQASAIRLGDATSVGHGHQVGWDASILFGTGITTVTGVKEEECGCD